MDFYKITPEQAALVGAFKYSPCCAFDPFTGEQTDGSFLVSIPLYEDLKRFVQFDAIDWGTCPKITEAQALADLKELDPE